MKGKAFLDTNIFVYTQSATAIKKKAISLNAISKCDCSASTQVLNELCNVLLKKFSMDIDKVLQIITAVNASCKVCTVTAETIKMALRLKERYGYSYYDSLILASALESGCTYLFSEDMSDGQMIEQKLEIVNIYSRPDVFAK